MSKELTCQKNINKKVSQICIAAGKNYSNCNLPSYLTSSSDLIFFNLFNLNVKKE